MDRSAEHDCGGQRVGADTRVPELRHVALDVAGDYFEEIARLPPEEAIASLRRRAAVPKGEFAKMSARERAQSFTVAGVVDLDIVSDVLRSIEKAVADGQTLEEWQEAIGDTLRNAWAGTVANPSARMETIFRTNVQSAYAAGRYAEATDPDTLAMRPYWMYSAVMDDRTTEVCAACDGVVRPASDAFWHTHNPPAHYNCRSTLITLSEDLAKEYGVSHKPPAWFAPPMKGFGGPPDLAWQPKATDYPDDAWREFHAKMADGADRRPS